MSNLALIPKFGPGTSFAIVNNSDWLDMLLFVKPGYPAGLTQVTGAIASGSSTVTVADTSSLVQGMTIGSIAAGIPGGAFVGAITSPTTFPLVDALGALVTATATEAEIPLLLAGPPLDLTGINFTAVLRRTVGQSQQWLALSTADGTLVSGNKDGTFGFNVPCIAMTVGGAQMRGLPAGNYVLDIVAADDTNTVNLFPEGPATVVVAQAVTIP